MHDAVQCCGYHLRTGRARRASERGGEQESNGGKTSGARHADLQLDVSLNDDDSKPIARGADERNARGVEHRVITALRTGANLTTSL